MLDAASLAALVANHPGLTWVREPGGRLLAASPSARERLGAALDNGVVARGDLGGSPAEDLRVDGVPLRLVRTAVDGLVWSVAEVRDEVVALRSALAESEARLDRSERWRELLELVSIGGAGEVCTDTGQLVASPALLRVFGREGRVSSWDDLFAGCDPSDRDRLAEARDHVAAGGGSWFGEVAWREATGLSHWLRVGLRLERRADGARLLVAARDVDRRHVEEEALERLCAAAGATTGDPAQWIESLANAFAVDAAFYATLDGGHFVVAAHSGDPLLVGTSCAIADSPVALALANLGRVAVAGVERRFPRDPLAAGHDGWVAVALRDGNGAATGVFGVVCRRGLPSEAVVGPGLELVGRIVAAHQRGVRAEAEARSARGTARRAARLEALAAFVGGVAHDYNNLLTALFGRVDLARDVLANDHPARQELHAIERITVSAAGLTAQLLAFARPRLEDVGELDVGDVLVGLDPVVRPLLAGRVELEVVGALERLRVRVDRGQLEQVLVNLVVNARDASPVGGLVRLEVFTGHLDAAAVGELGKLAPGPWVAIAVGDRGPGVAPELAERIFDPFFTTKGPGAGTGLGLATVREIAQTYCGHVAVANNPGGGALFTVYFSRVIAAPATA